MQNDAPPDPPLNPFQSAFGSKARDPASLDRAMREAELEKSEGAAISAELSGDLFWLPFLVVAVWLLGQPGIALGLWAFAVLFGSPIYLWQIDQRRPRNDIARAAALHAYGLLGWPLGLLAFLASGSLVVVFPVVFGLGVGAWIWAGRARLPPPPSADRAAFLAGGAIIYAATIPAAAAAIWWVVQTQGGVNTFGLLLIFLALLYSSGPAIGAVQLSRAALKAWRERATAAAPASD